MSHSNNKAKALTAYLAERQAAPFDWRTANCLHFAGRFVERVEGTSPLKGQAMPTTLTGARRIQRRGGGLGVIVTAALHREPIPALMAQIGDVVLLPLDAADPEALAVGLCCGEQAALLGVNGELVYLPMAVALQAWRVGA